VRKGEPLLVRSSGDADARLDVARRTLEAARAASDEACTGASLARRELERSEGLFREGIASDQQVDQLRSRRDAAESTCQAARARIGEAEATLALARVGRRQIELVAPFDGLVADVSTEVGEWITPSPPGLPIPAVIEMFDPSSLFVAAPLDEVEVGKVAVGLPVRITMDACPGKAFSGKLTRIAPIVLDRVEQNRTFEIEVEFDDAAFARTLLPGTSADVEVIREARDGVLRIPSYALVAGKRVLVAREGRLVSTEVATGLRNWAFVEVRSGLAAGDLVVVSLDRAEVRDGARVAATEEIAK
jgi:HlyD family secretion protein